MTENQRTSIFVAAAALLALVAYFAVPARRAPGLFDDQGELFYAEFDPLECGSVEVTSFDPDENAPRVFKVEFKDGRWAIPSHEGYPADAKDQIAKISSIVNGLRKGAIRSDREKDLPSYDLLDPLDDRQLSAEGRGKRLALKDRTGKVLTDLIIGGRVKGRSGQSYVRKPDSSRVYSCELDASAISTRFADWVETDVLQLGGKSIKEIVLNRYRVDERTATIIPGDVLTLSLKDSSDWTLEGLDEENEELDQSKVRSMRWALDDLTLVGVRRKPAMLLDALKRLEEGKPLAEHDQVLLGMLLGPRGYYVPLNAEKGREIVSNEGELRVACEDGVVYKLLFGEVVYGKADDISAASEDKEEPGAEAEEADAAEDAEDEATEDDALDRGAEHRYLWVTVDFDESLLGEKPQPPEKPEGAEGASPDAPADNADEPDAGQAAEDADEDEGDPEKEYEEAVKAYEEDLKDYDEKVEDGRKRADELKRRFAEWYYVVSADAYAKLDLGREDLVKAKEKEDEGDAQEHEQDRDEEKDEEAAGEEADVTDAEPTEGPAE